MTQINFSSKLAVKYVSGTLHSNLSYISRDAVEQNDTFFVMDFDNYTILPLLNTILMI